MVLKYIAIGIIVTIVWQMLHDEVKDFYFLLSENHGSRVYYTRRFTMNTTYRVSKNDRGKAHALLASAFHEEIELIIKRFGIKQQAAMDLFSTPLSMGFSKGEVHASSERMEGLIVFIPGELSDFGLFTLLTSGAFFRSRAALKLMLHRDVRTIFTQLSSDKKSLRLGPYYYLAVLGVSADHQGKGIGGSLLDELCKKADTEGRALYLETQSERNVAWYKGYGFKVLKKLGSAESLELWEMARERQ